MLITAIWEPLRLKFNKEGECDCCSDFPPDRGKNSVRREDDKRCCRLTGNVLNSPLVRVQQGIGGNNQIALLTIPPEIYGSPVRVFAFGIVHKNRGNQRKLIFCGLSVNQRQRGAEFPYFGQTSAPVCTVLKTRYPPDDGR